MPGRDQPEKGEFLQVDRNIFFHQATIRICGSLDIHSAMLRCYQYIRDFIPVNRISLRIYAPDMNVMQTIASIIPDGRDELPRIFPLPEEQKARWTAEWERMEEIQILNKPESDPELLEILKRAGQSPDISFMRIRLELEGKRVGGLVLGADGTDRYTEEHAELALLLHEPFAIAMANALQHQELIRLKDMLADDNRYLNRQLLDLSGSEVVGADFGLRRVMEMVHHVAPMDSPVLLLGETGSGKEVVANAIHCSSPRNSGAFIKVNCGAIPDSLMDSELFGHEKGAFTGAITTMRGRFERAEGGTIFLDEIGELPPQAQVRLLNVLQNREIERVGGSRAIPVNIRILSATNRNLEEMVRAGQFREDLWFRINVFPIMIPPLRQRKGDIPALVHHFIEKKSLEMKIVKRTSLAPGAMDRLLAHHWPGNVRELQNIIERAMIQCRGAPLMFEDLHTRDLEDEPVQEEDRGRKVLKLDEVNAIHIRRALGLAGGKIHGPEGAAELLGIHPNTLRKRMDKLGIPFRRRERDPKATTGTDRKQ